MLNIASRSQEKFYAVAQLGVWSHIIDKLSNFEKNDCFQNNRGHAAKCYWSDDVINVFSSVILGS